MLTRAADLPGPLNGQFWCTPGPFDMALAPGGWQVGIRRGVEHEEVFEEVAFTSGGTVAKTFRPRRWVDMRRRGWWSGDDHVHYRLLNDDDGRRLMAWVRAEDIHLANVVKMGDIYRTYFEQRGFGPAQRVVQGDTALVPGQECPPDRWFDAFRRGRTFTTSGPMLEFRVEHALPGDELKVASNRPLRVRARAWGDPRRMAPVKLVREGLRFWKYDGLDELLAKRAESLAQIESLVAEARQLEAEGRLENDRYRQQLALQGPALLERVARARELYTGLKRTAEAERSRRVGRPN